MRDSHVPVFYPDDPSIYFAPLSLIGLLSGDRTRTTRIVRRGEPFALLPRMWVREPWGLIYLPTGTPYYGENVPSEQDRAQFGVCHHFQADDFETGLFAEWRSSQSMPWWASRMMIEVEDASIRRLHDVTVDEIWEEGLMDLPTKYLWGNPIELDNGRVSELTHYRAAWEILHGPGSWAKNPKVWSVKFTSRWVP